MNFILKFRVRLSILLELVTCLLEAEGLAYLLVHVGIGVYLLIRVER